MPSLLLFLLGLAALAAGAEALVRGASRLATSVGVSPLVIGLTVVAWGTGSPEMAVSVDAALGGQADVVLGNVVGSNILNVLFILGASAVIVPLAVHQQLVRLDVPIMIGVSIVMLALASDGRIGRGEGGMLLAGLLVYTGVVIWMGRRESAAVAQEYAAEVAIRAGRPHGWAPDVLQVAIGLALLAVGAHTLIAAATDIARSLGVSELVISLTLVAAGTSMPEIATSIMAAVRGDRDIAVGNVVGSNIFNILAVLGAAAAVAPDGVMVSAAVRTFDMPVAIAVAAVCLPISASGAAIARWEGGVLLAYYVAYVSYLYLDATQHAATGAYTRIMLTVVLPLTAITLGVMFTRSVLASRRARAPS
ncbi:MAG TPA: calcium/sodium antiporter [Candidatus Limnocylindria bacterium]|nr:calcium/sodium antiporter [Candidatus Limnocylindria bacterium]